MKTRCLPLLALCLSFSAFGKANFDQMESKLNQLHLLQESMPTLNVEPYVRELQYEKMDLSHVERAEIETNKIAELIKAQIYQLYQGSVKRLGDESAAHDEILAAIETDLTLVAPDLQEEIRQLSLEALRQVEAGAVYSSPSPELSGLEKEMLKASLERSAFLNSGAFSSITGKNKLPPASGSKDAEKNEYRTRGELVESITSDRDSSSWFNTAGQDIVSQVSTFTDGEISFRFKTKFLGVAVEAGPVIRIKKEISTSARLTAEGQYPLIGADGNFLFHKLDRSGQKITKDGKPVRRFIAFYCDATLRFETDYNGSGSFTYMGIGGSVGRGRSVSDSVSMDSRQVFLPQFVEGKSVTMPLLRQICHNDYLNAKINNRMTLKQSLYISMKNLLAGAIFIHPKTKCAVDSHCIGWFKKEKLAILGNKVVPRCVEDRNEKYRTCVVGARAGQNCPVFTKGKLVSRPGENICDRGLSCVKVKQEGPLWLQYAVGVCKPTNPKTYKAPALVK